MSDFKAFFSENVKKVEEVEYVVSDRFTENGEPIKWRLKALTAKEEEGVRADSTIRTPIPGKHGQYTEKLDTNAYVRKLTTASVVYPDLFDADLQNSYGVTSPEALLQKMLLSGEMIHLTEKVTEINNLTESFEDKVEHAKN